MPARGAYSLKKKKIYTYIYMGSCQHDWLVTGPLAHTCYIPRYIGYVTEGGFRDIPKNLFPAEDMKAARQGVCNRLGYVTEGLWRGTRQQPFSAHPHIYIYIMQSDSSIIVRFQRTMATIAGQRMWRKESKSGMPFSAEGAVPRGEILTLLLL